MQEKNWTDVKKILSELAEYLNIKGIRGIAKHYGVKDGMLYGWIKRGKISDTGVILGKNPEINRGWLLTGTGPMKISGTVAPKAQVASFKRAEDGPEEKESQPEIDVHKGVLMTTKVLSSKTGYANALWHNLKSFDAAVDREDEVGEMKEMMKEMMEKIDRLEQQLGGQPAKTEKKQAAN